MRLILVLFLSLFIMSCTRSLDDKTGLKLVIPASSKLQAQQTTTMMMPMFASVSIHYSDRPTISRSFELKDRFSSDGTAGTNDPITTTDLEIYVPSVVQGSNALIQLLVVYEDPNGGLMEFNYGDVTSSITGGENFLDITVAPIGTSTQETIFAGRYLEAANQGPTGMVSMMLHPPNGKPAMEIEKEPINNGWFSFFHPGGGAEISYVIKAQKKVLFAKLTDTSSVFTTGNHLLKLNMPSHSSKDGYGYYSSEVETNLFFGFFQSQSSTLDFSSYKACFSNRAHAIPGAYSALFPSFSPLIFNPGGTLGSDVVVSGGIGMSFDQLYNSTNCDVSTGTNVVLHSEHLGDHGLEDYALGAMGPFAMINPFQKHDSAFVKSAATSSSIDLNWSYLPGVLGDSISGTTIFAKYDYYGTGGNHYDDMSCREQAELDGMVAIDDISGVSYSYVGGGGLPLPTDPSVNIRDFKFMLCPYKDLSSGERLYSREGVSVHCIGGCNERFNYGLGETDATISTNKVLNTVGDAYGAYVSGYSINTPSNTIELTTSNPWGTTAFVAGDEVVLNVVAAGNDGICNATGTETVGPGYFLFTRVLSIAPLTIPRNAIIETIDSAELAATGRTPVDNFCLLTVTKVLEYRDLNLSAELSTTVADLVNSSVQNIFIKVSGNLNLTGTPVIKATGKGFNGGAVGDHGGGIKGIGNPSNSTMTGGQPDANFAGGGASFGVGGINFANISAQGLYHEDSMYMGGGGAGGSSLVGKNGGGLIYITARHINMQANTIIEANGIDASGYEGAGAGGNIWFLFDTMTNDSGYTLNISAKGGYAGISGAGGGGLIKGQTCNSISGTISFDNSGGGTTGSILQEGGAGNDPYAIYDSWACEN